MTIRTSEEGRRLRHARCLPSKPVEPEVVRNDLAKDLSSCGLLAEPFYDPLKASHIKKLPLFRIAEGESLDEVMRDLAR